MDNPDCIFCKIVTGEIPSEKIYETDNVLGFMDVNPLATGHSLFIPKAHAEKAHEVGEAALSEILIAIKKVANAMDVTDYNILQNNGRIAHQAVMHVHFHLIPKPDEKQGLGIIWKPQQDVDQASIAQSIRDKLMN